MSVAYQDSGHFYGLNAGALAYMEQHEIKAKRHRRIITEGVLMGGLLAQGIPVNFRIISDDAG